MGFRKKNAQMPQETYIHKKTSQTRVFGLKLEPSLAAIHIFKKIQKKFQRIAQGFKKLTTYVANSPFKVSPKASKKLPKHQPFAQSGHTESNFEFSFSTIVMVI
jgi:hypothetical protein